MDALYFDYAAATPMDDSVLSVMAPYFSDKFYNPSAMYLSARAAKADIEAARAKIAHVIGANPSEILFTSGGTEGDNLAVHGIMQAAPSNSKVLYLAIEHEAVIEPAKAYPNAAIPVDQKGIIDLVELKKLIQEDVALISVGYVNNEIGVVQPLADIARYIKDVNADRRARGVKAPLYLHTDACQALGHVSVNVARLGVDLLTINGSKIYGPKGTGALYVRAGVKMSPILSGGGQERGLRSGTENVPGIIGLAQAVSLTAGGRQVGEKTRLLRQKAEQLILEKFPDAIIIGHAKFNSGHILNVIFPGVDNETLMMQLDERGVIVATGSACSASKGEASHVLRALGTDEATARSSIRISLGRQTCEADIEKLVATLADCLIKA